MSDNLELDPWERIFRRALAAYWSLDAGCGPRKRKLPCDMDPEITDGGLWECKTCGAITDV